MGVVDSWIHVFHDGEPDTPVVLALHGTGGDENDLVRLGQAVLPGSPVLSPRGQVSEQGMNRWFKRLREGVFDVDDVIAQAGALAGFVTEALTHYGLEGRPIVAVGFSNGANIATATALLHPDVVNQVVAFSGMFPFGDRDPVGDVSGVRLFMANGEVDPMAPQSSGDLLEAVATKHGATVTRFLRAGSHGITDEDLRHAQQWLGH
jgi:phospholipase/carboxylesterase